MGELAVEAGTPQNIDELARLYDALCDHLQSGTNYPGWRKGLYPTRNEAETGVNSGTLYVAKRDDVIAGTIILNHRPEPAYADADWSFESDYSDVLVVHTLAVHPNYHGEGVGQTLMEFAVDQAICLGMRAIRLDTYAYNLPAVRLYEKNGFRCTGIIDLGFGEYGLHTYKAFELLLNYNNWRLEE